MYILGEYRHPTFLYESMWNLLGLIIILIGRRKNKKARIGDFVCFYLIWYGLGRSILIEPFRTDALMLGDIRINVLIPALFALCGTIWLVLKHTKLKAERYLDYQAQIKAKYAATIEELKTKLNQITVERDKLQQEINTLTSQQSIYIEKYNKLIYDQNNWDKYYEKLQKEIESLQGEVSKNNSLITLLEGNKQEIVDHLVVVKKMETLIKRDFRGYLLENIIKYIDRVAKDYCEIVFKTRDLDIYLDGNALDISYCGKMFDNLSGGEKQRILLARALARKPKILILDEATSALDNTSEKHIQEEIEKMKKENNTTIIAIAHRLTTLKNCDRIIVLNKGCIQEDGKFDDLISKGGMFSDMYHGKLN
jgi:ABC-type phosphate/phosphonate transport system ATPase subunit